MANVSYLRPEVRERPAPRARRRRAAARQPRSPRRYVIAGLGLLLIVVIGLGVAFVTSGASLSTDTTALAKVEMPFGGGTIQRISVVTGPNSAPIPVEVRGDELWPQQSIPVHTAVQIQVVVKRPGWISWLAGSTEKLSLTMLTPAAALKQQYLTLSAGAPLRLQFKQPVSVFSYGSSASDQHQETLPSPLDTITLTRTAAAGTVWVAAAPRTWERANPTVVSWFPAGAAASAVATPAPGSTIGPQTPISLTFSTTVDQALGSARPPVSPNTPGTWHSQGPHTIVFQPVGYGYGLGATVKVPLPNGIQLVGQNGSTGTGTWNVPAGSTTRLQQLLAGLGYLPLRFRYQGARVPLDAADQEAAAVNTPSGRFSWRYDNVPGELQSMWQPGSSGVMTRGAVMAFENDHGITPDGDAGPDVWRALIGAVLAGHTSTFGYTFVSVDESSQSLTLWHSGNTVLTTPVNTGIESAPTAKGTFPVYLHEASGTMSGTNPDGSHYNDPGVPWISYFNGGDALHGFDRASYGSPQSLGCVEMPVQTAGQVFPYTPVGTLVSVH